MLKLLAQECKIAMIKYAKVCSGESRDQDRTESQCKKKGQKTQERGEERRLEIEKPVPEMKNTSGGPTKSEGKKNLELEVISINRSQIVKQREQRWKTCIIQ